MCKKNKKHFFSIYACKTASTVNAFLRWKNIKTLFVQLKTSDCCKTADSTKIIYSIILDKMYLFYSKMFFSLYIIGLNKITFLKNIFVKGKKQVFFKCMSKTGLKVSAFLQQKT